MRQNWLESISTVTVVTCYNLLTLAGELLHLLASLPLPDPTLALTLLYPTLPQPYLQFRYAREDAMSKLGGAVAEGAQLIEHLYLSFYQELQKPLLADHTSRGGSNINIHGQTEQAAVVSTRNEAAAKVIDSLYTMAGCCEH